MTHPVRLLSVMGSVLFIALAVARCGSSDAPAAGAVNPPLDAGAPPAVDAGGDAGAADAGSPAADAGAGVGDTDAGSGGPDAGPGGGSGPDGGTTAAGGYDVIDLQQVSGAYIAASLNNLGQVFGRSTAGSVIYDSVSGTTTIIHPPGRVTEIAFSDRGEALFNEEFDASAPFWTAPFVQRDYKKTYLPNFGGRRMYATSLGPNGEVVGHGQYPAAQEFRDRAFLWTPADNSLRDLGTLGGRDSSATFVDGSGTVLGWAMTAATTGNTTAAFSWRDGKMTALPDVGGPCIANWRAPTGTIVGVGSRLTGNSADVQPLIWSGGEVRILDKLSGDSYGYAAAVNSSGDIVGYSDTTNNNNNARAVLWRGGGAPVRIDSLATFPEGVNLWHGVAINERGQILAYGGRPGTGATYYLLTPRK
jgi:uncharacterized membrane protein